MRAHHLASVLLLSACIDTGWDVPRPTDDDTADDDTTPAADDDSAGDDDTGDDDTSPTDDDSTDDDTADDDSTDDDTADDDTADDDTTPDPADADGDGSDRLDAGGDDCDDADSTVFPGATEDPSDGVDDDCDGQVDENITATLLWPDDGIAGLFTYVEVGGTGLWGITDATLGGVAVIDLFVFADDQLGFVTPVLAGGDHDLVLSHALDSQTVALAFRATDDDSELDSGEISDAVEETLAFGVPSSDFVGAVTEPTVTDSPGAPAGVIAEVGYGNQATPPDTSADWWWSSTIWDGDNGGSDLFVATVTPHQYGSYNVAFRFSNDGGFSWLYADGDSSTAIDWMELPVVHVVP